MTVAPAPVRHRGGRSAYNGGKRIPFWVRGEMQFTAVYMQVPEGYIAFVEELPGANTQGDTLEEVRENLREAVELVVEANRELAARALRGQVVTKEPFDLAI